MIPSLGRFFLAFRKCLSECKGGNDGGLSVEFVGTRLLEFHGLGLD